MSRKQKKPASMPSKAYLVSFGDTMTALLAFFIVLNSLAKDQTGAKMHAGTGSFVNAIKSLGVPGEFSGDKSGETITKKAPTPIYAVRNDAEDQTKKGKGPDAKNDAQRIVNRQADEFKRFLSEMERRFDVDQDLPIRSQVVIDIWDSFQSRTSDLLADNGIQVASEAISQLKASNVNVELVVWADMPSPSSLTKAMSRSIQIRNQMDRLFKFDSPQQRSRLRFSAKPWLFVDAKRPQVSFVISKMSDSKGQDKN